MAFIVVFTLFLLFALSGLAWRRIKSKSKPADLVAKSNHHSVWSFHYGPATILPSREVVAPSPPPATGNALARLMPDEDQRVQQEQARAAAAADSEATKNRTAEQAQQPDTPGLASGKDAAAAPLQSSRHAPGAKVNVLDILGTDRPAPTVAPATAEAATVADSEPAEPEAAREATVPQAIYSNPLTEATRTKNDEANRKAAAELRKATGRPSATAPIARKPP
ncbi:hypothetical protein [Hymenobacter sp. 102]|uniref:hypothetical protein n=1 Tax=Hymenobacter sp. 102 TaxID=3403152 RepID=UPI003CF8A84F